LALEEQPDWSIPVLKTVATTDQGLEELVASLKTHRAMQVEGKLSQERKEIFYREILREELNLLFQKKLQLKSVETK